MWSFYHAGRSSLFDLQHFLALLDFHEILNLVHRQKFNNTQSLLQFYRIIQKQSIFHIHIRYFSHS